MTMSMNETGASQKKTFLEFDKCTPLDDVTPWCYTRVDENGTYILGTYFCTFEYLKRFVHTISGQWGYCSEQCTGERPDYESDYNLAMRHDLWTTGLFDLSTWSLIG